LPLPAIVGCAALWKVAEKAVGAVGNALPSLVTASLAVFLVFRMLALSGDRSAVWHSVSTPAGSLVLPEPVASTTRLALQDLQRRLPSEGMLAGFPEAGFFNYVLGRLNPLPLEQFFPGHLDSIREGQVIAKLRRSSPDVVLMINVLAVGEGARIFGKDYLVSLDEVIRRDFTTAAVFGPGARAGARIGDPEFFIEVRVPRRSPG
jgi:hypothetical protein